MRVEGVAEFADLYIGEVFQHEGLWVKVSTYFAVPMKAAVPFHPSREVGKMPVREYINPDLEKMADKTMANQLGPGVVIERKE